MPRSIHRSFQQSLEIVEEFLARKIDFAAESMQASEPIWYGCRYIDASLSRAATDPQKKKKARAV